MKTLSLFLSVRHSLSRRIVVVVNGGMFTFVFRCTQLREIEAFSYSLILILFFSELKASKGVWSVMMT